MPNEKKASTAVTVMWLVTAKVCSPGSTASGSTPTRLANRMKKNSEKMYGANFLPPLPMFTLTIESMNPTAPSTISCHLPGISLRCRPPTMKMNSSAATTNMNSAELVKEMS